MIHLLMSSGRQCQKGRQYQKWQWISCMATSCFKYISSSWSLYYGHVLKLHRTTLIALVLHHWQFRECGWKECPIQYESFVLYAVITMHYHCNEQCSIAYLLWEHRDCFLLSITYCTKCLIFSFFRDLIHVGFAFVLESFLPLDYH